MTTAPRYRLPMFPLGTPLLPGRLLPLRLFEPRYLAMLRECSARPVPEFGVVLIERGTEVGGGDQRTSVGTVAEILEAVPRPSGDVGVVALGRRRLRVVDWLEDDPHPWAIVEDWDDESGPTMTDSSYRTRVLQVLERIGAIADLTGGGRTEILEQLRDSVEVLDPSQMSFALTGAVGFGSADQHRLLACAGVTERLECMMELLDDLEAVIRFRLSPGSDD